MSTKTPLVLVTGASGFIAGHIVKQLCERGYRVRGTVRKISKQHAYIYQLAKDKEHRPIELVECDLAHDANWDKAIEGCDYVIHTASVMPDARVGPNNEPVQMTDDEFIPPVLKGMERILNACLKHSKTVKKLVYTTSVAAMDPEAWNTPPHRRGVTYLTANNWTPLDKPEAASKTTGYMKSKTLAEKLAWDFVKKHNYPFELVTIAPAMTVGPLLTSRLPASMNLLKTLLDRQYPVSPQIHWKVSDVRDVATSHVNALTSTEANRKRYVIVNAMLWMTDIAKFLDFEFGPKGFSITQTTGPYWMFWIFGYFNPLIRSFVLPQYGKLRLCDASPAIKDLQIAYINPRDMLLDGANSLIEHKLVTVPAKFYETTKSKL